MMQMQIARESPPGYAKVQMEQLIRADRELFTLMATNTQDLLSMAPEVSSRWIS